MRVFIIAATTADGFIAKSGTHGADWTGKEDKKVFVRLTKEAGTIVMGSRTFATIGRALPGRRNIVYTSKPESITAEEIETTAEDPNTLVARLEKEGVSALAVCGGRAIYDLFMQSGIVNELYVTIIPKLFGSGVGLFKGNLNVDLQLLTSEELGGGAVLLHYKVSKT